MASTTYYDYVLADGATVGGPHGMTVILCSGLTKLSQDVTSGDFVCINGRTGQVVEVGTVTVTDGVGSARTVLNTLGE